MSILLDALKKSEAQRQLGQTPTLETNLDGHLLSNDDNNILLPASLIVLAAVLITWFGYRQFQLPDDFAGVPVAPGVTAETNKTSTPPKVLAEVDSGTSTVTTPVMDFEATNETAVAANEDTGSARDEAPTTVESS